MKFNLEKSKPYIFLSALVLLLPVIDFFGIPIPKVAWDHQIKQVENAQLETSVDLYSRELSRQRYESLKLEREKNKIQREEGEIPEPVLKEQNYLESDIINLKERIETARKRILENKK